MRTRGSMRELGWLATTSRGPSGRGPPRRSTKKKTPAVHPENRERRDFDRVIQGLGLWGVCVRVTPPSPFQQGFLLGPAPPDAFRVSPSAALPRLVAPLPGIVSRFL